MLARLILGACLVSWLGPASASFFPGKGPAPFPGKFQTLDTDALDTFLQSFETKVGHSVASQGGKLKIVVEPGNTQVNARALREGNDWLIVVYGGLIQHPEIDEQALTLILCHELGHHLGGPPTAARNGWASCEGQADYWSTLQCFGHFYPVTEGAQAALRVAQLYSTQTLNPAPSLESKDPTEVPRIYYGYPSPQCRLDTMMAGLMQQARPLCWYRQQD